MNDIRDDMQDFSSLLISDTKVLYSHILKERKDGKEGGKEGKREKERKKERKEGRKEGRKEERERKKERKKKERGTSLVVQW